MISAVLENDRKLNMRKRICVSLLVALALCLSLAPTALAEGEPWVEAAGAIVLDHDTGEVYFEKNADTARPVASMTKVMSVYLVFEEIAAGGLSPDSRITASPRAAEISNNPEYSGMEKLSAGESYPVDTLLRLIMTSSCNGAVLVLAEHIGGGSEAVFVERMNAKAEEMGIDAHFADCCGIVDDGNAVTPRAMALLARRTIEDYPQILEYSSLKSTYFDNRIFKSSNLLLSDNKVAGIDGLKTGTTAQAGFCFTATAKRNGQRIIAVVINAASREAIMSDCQALLEYGFVCRGEREAVWSAEEKQVCLTIGASMDTLYPHVPARLTATVSGLSDGVSIPCVVQWTVNGAVKAKETGVVQNGEAVSSVSYTILGRRKRLNIRCTISMPYGTTVESRLVLPVSQRKITFTGQLGKR